mgnify:CR=1 FL=1
MFEKYVWKCVWYGDDCQKCGQIEALLEKNNIKTVCNAINLDDTFNRVRILRGEIHTRNMGYRYELLVSGKNYEKAKMLIRKM